MKTTFISKVNDYAPAIGTIVTLETPDVAEMLSLCGFDWLFIDMEHGHYPREQRSISSKL